MEALEGYTPVVVSKLFRVDVLRFPSKVGCRERQNSAHDKVARKGHP